MARVKNTLRVSSEEGTALPRAVFPEVRLKKKKLVKCDTCGLLLWRSNLSRHVKKQHAEVLTVKLPAVAKFLSHGKERDGTGEETVAEEEGREARLPTTPQSEDELNRELAKLYAARVPAKPVEAPLSYSQTRALMSLARDEARREELRQVMSAAGLLVYTEEERDKMLQKAREEGRSQRVLEDAEAIPVLSSLSPRGSEEVDTAEVIESAALPESSKTGVQSEPVCSAPPVTVTSVFGEGKPQTVTIHLGGTWGLELHPVKL